MACRHVVEAKNLRGFIHRREAACIIVEAVAPCSCKAWLNIRVHFRELVDGQLEHAVEDPLGTLSQWQQIHEPTPCAPAAIKPLARPIPGLAPATFADLTCWCLAANALLLFSILREPPLIALMLWCLYRYVRPCLLEFEVPK